MDWFKIWYVLQVFDINKYAMNPYIFYVFAKWITSPRGGGSDSFNMWIVRLHTLGFSTTQIMSNYKQKPRELVKDSIIISLRERMQFHNKEDNTTRYSIHDGKH